MPRIHMTESESFLLQLWKRIGFRQHSGCSPVLSNVLTQVTTCLDAQDSGLTVLTQTGLDRV